jgi:hypothetical protein
MSLLAPEADLAVRDAVDAFIAGAYRPAVPRGETLFETKNSRYRLMEGVLFSASDASLVGAELVGWLIEAATTSVVTAWIPGARAIFVDRRREHCIIVTSTAHLFRVDAPLPWDGSPGSHPGSAMIQGGRPLPPPNPPPLSTRAPAPLGGEPFPLSERRPLRDASVSTPLPRASAAPRSAPPHPPPRFTGRGPASVRPLPAPLPYPTPPPRIAPTSPPERRTHTPTPTSEPIPLRREVSPVSP